MDVMPKLKVGIIGSGKIGTDLLIKILKSQYLSCELFVGRNAKSDGLKKAHSLKVPTSDQSLAAFEQHGSPLDLVFDATSAHHHREHAGYFSSRGIKAVDLTPARVGAFCVPAIDGNQVTDRENINMVTCGGQASIPVITTLARLSANIEHIEVHSLLAKDSVGPATLANIDEYYSTTAGAITQYSSIESVDVHLAVEKSDWKPDMLTRIRAHYARTDDCDMEGLYNALSYVLEQVRQYAPGYTIVGTPSLKQGALEILVCVRGAGDWIPSHAGNLDIINCAAISVAERYALSLGIDSTNKKRKHSYLEKVFGSLAGLSQPETSPVSQ